MGWYTGRSSQLTGSFCSVVQEEMPSVENEGERYCGGLRCVREVWNTCLEHWTANWQDKCGTAG